MYILNAFSANMVAAFPAAIELTEISPDTARAMAVEGTSAVGHADTASVFSSLLGVSVPMQRATVSLNKGDVALLGQYSGPRLPEGSTTLPAGATIKWIRVELK